MWQIRHAERETGDWHGGEWERQAFWRGQEGSERCRTRWDRGGESPVSYVSESSGRGWWHSQHRLGCRRDDDREWRISVSLDPRRSVAWRSRGELTFAGGSGGGIRAGWIRSTQREDPRQGMGEVGEQAEVGLLGSRSGAFR